MATYNSLAAQIEQLNAIGIALSAENDKSRLLEKILDGAQALTNADGGTLYLLKEDQLHFAIMHTRSLGVTQVGPLGQLMLPPISLHDEEGKPNQHTVAAYAALSRETINIANISDEQYFDFSGTLAYDKKTGYHSQSFLTIPLCNHEHEVIGVLQLINAQEPDSNYVIPFSDGATRLAESLASQAAVALNNQQLIGELKGLLEKFIEVIAEAIDEKSPYTGGHCRRVPEIAMLIANAINRCKDGPLGDFAFNSQQLYELHIAALLHDCGKITTPIHVVDKATKLETIFDRIHLVESRFEILRRDAEIAQLKAQLRQQGIEPECSTTLRQQLSGLDEEFEFIRHSNQGSEFMSDEKRARIDEIASRKWQNRFGEEQSLLTDEELYNMHISKGTLTIEEREQINNHIVRTIRMLEALPFPRHLQNVPEIAGGHHERMDGQGYPRGLKRDQLSIPARLMGIADIFEALTASDRPYKRPMPISVALNIMGNMSQEGHIDPEIFEVFVREKVYEEYARRYLPPEQIDEVDISTLPGFEKNPKPRLQQSQ